MNSRAENIFRRLRNVLRLEERYLPFIVSLEDRDITVQIGYHEINGAPLTVTRLQLLDIGSHPTVGRRLAALVAKGIVVKRANCVDGRSFTLHLSENTKRCYKRYLTAALRVN